MHCENVIWAGWFKSPLANALVGFGCLDGVDEMLQKNLRFIGNLLIVSVLSVIIVNISSLPVYIYLITANWFTLLVSFSLYAVIIIFLYNIYKSTAELRQFDFRPWRARLNKRALLLMVIGAVIILSLIHISEPPRP